MKVRLVVTVVLAGAAGCGSGTRSVRGHDDAAAATVDTGAGGTAADATVDAPNAQDAAGGEPATEDAPAVDDAASPEDAATADAGPDASDAHHVWTPGPSCAGLAPICGPTGTSDCCASSVIPGGTFNRVNDPMWPATVSDFRLDLYEVNVGRFRAFVNAYPGNFPAPGSGRNPNDRSDTGWDASWTSMLPVDTAALKKMLKCDPFNGFATWTDTPSTNENLPANCITWAVAQAFCIWDGGRLPTQAEWNYAAAGGSEQRVYPWANPPDSRTLDPSYAVYQTATTMNQGTAPVGSRSPRGDGKWGQADLAGNVWELTRDQLDLNAPGLGYLVPCDDCINAVPVNAIKPGSSDATRGGGFLESPAFLFPGAHIDTPIFDQEVDVGARCARAP